MGAAGSRNGGFTLGFTGLVGFETVATRDEARLGSSLFLKGAASRATGALLVGVPRFASLGEVPRTLVLIS